MAERLLVEKGSNLPAVPTTLAIASADAAGTMEKMRDASPDGFTMLNLDTITFPTADSLTFNVPTAEGLEPHRVLDVILVHQHPARKRYKEAYDPTAQPAPPTCVSYDGVYGYGEPGGVCVQCPFFMQRGPDAECRPYRWLYFLFPENVFPTFLSLPRTSLSRKLIHGISKYIVDLAKGGRAHIKGGLWRWEVMTRIGLADRVRGIGKVASFTEGPRLPESLRAVVEPYVKDFRANLTFPQMNDVGSDPTGGSNGASYGPRDEAFEEDEGEL